ncbi:unnamed protein product [Protopolystoma xenopodis]|uniref:Uncharacterized protein n=1 Tax=Protopolystoma xenopodis TaxID=117903 RepID=A0A3S5AIN0_9PLAT|nr:unnamed protein product [Protopolystoma xenopodis]
MRKLKVQYQPALLAGSTFVQIAKLFYKFILTFFSISSPIKSLASNSSSIRVGEMDLSDFEDLPSGPTASKVSVSDSGIINEVEQTTSKSMATNESDKRWEEALNQMVRIFFFSTSIFLTYEFLFS